MCAESVTSQGIADSLSLMANAAKFDQRFYPIFFAQRNHCSLTGQVKGISESILRRMALCSWLELTEVDPTHT